MENISMFAFNFVERRYNEVETRLEVANRRGGRAGERLLKVDQRVVALGMGLMHLVQMLVQGRGVIENKHSPTMNLLLLLLFLLHASA